MIVNYSKKFKKNYKLRIKPYPRIKKKYQERLTLFLNNPSTPILKDHALIGKMKTFRAFSIAGDIRVIYSKEASNTVLFIDIGTHNQVYN